MTKKLDSFSINGVSFETLEQIYKSTVNNLSNDLEDSNNDVIKTIAYQFMQALNEKREDFMTNDSDYDDRQDDLYKFDQISVEERQKTNIDHTDVPLPKIESERVDEIKQSIERQLISEARYSENIEPTKLESINNPMIDNFPLENEYKVIESRPKTTLQLLSSIEDRKDVNFELSPSNTNSNSKNGKHCQFISFSYVDGLRKSNMYTNTHEDDNQSKIAQFLTDEKNFESLTSKRPNTIQQDNDYESVPNSDLLSQVRPGGISDHLPSVRPLALQVEREIDRDLIEARIQQEKDAINEEWEQKLDARDKEHIKVMEALQKANEYYSKRAEEHDQLKQQLDKQQQQIDQQKQFTEEIINKYEKAVQQNIDAVKRQQELEEERNNQRRQIENMHEMNSENVMRRYAEQNINNPMDLNMSLVIKDPTSKVMNNQSKNYYFSVSLTLEYST